MPDEYTLSETDWDVLVAVPFAVFLLVAYADGRLAPAERRAFVGLVDRIGTRARSTDDALVREVMGRISRDPGQIMERLDGQVGAGLPYYEVFAAARSLLDDLPQRTHALAFTEAMVHLAEEVARAWPILGRRTSAEEERSIDFIRDQLRPRDDVGVDPGPSTGTTRTA
jgi:Ser/Thr protein kinase RdoA (MazF antagonist)